MCRPTQLEQAPSSAYAAHMQYIQGVFIYIYMCGDLPGVELPLERVDMLEDPNVAAPATWYTYMNMTCA